MSDSVKTIEIEDIATVFLSEFLKHNSKRVYDHRILTKDFIKMNYNRRKKLVSKTIDLMMEDLKQS